MASWTELEQQAPEIARAGARLLAAHEVAFLATVSRGGRPRVHPFCPVLVDRRLWAFVMAESPKRGDIDANGQFAIHAWPGDEDEQFFVGGRAQRVRPIALARQQIRY